MNVMPPVILARENDACMDRALRAARSSKSVLVVIHPWADVYLVQFSTAPVLPTGFAVPVHLQDQLEAAFLGYREAANLPGHPWTYVSPTGSMQPVRPADLDSYLQKMIDVYGSWDGRWQADVTAVLA